MKTRASVILLLLFIFTLAGGCGARDDASAPDKVNQTDIIKLNISAAASLQDALKEVIEDYESDNPGVKITPNFGSSGTLQKQIEEGAPADLFLSAGKKQMDALEEKGLIINESRKDFLANELVLIAGKDSGLQGFSNLTDESVKKISIAEPETVPAGSYAKEVLTSMGLYDILQPKIVPAKDVRQVLTYVQTGNVSAGLVYKSDTYQADNIKIVAAAPEDSHKPIVYPLAVIKASKNPEAAQAFADYLSGPEAKAIFSKYLFIPAE